MGKYIEYSEQGGSASAPAIYLRRKCEISFNSAASKLLKLEHGCKIIFLQEETNKSNWYIKLSEEDKGIPICKNKKGFVCRCALVTNTMLDSLDVLDKSGRFRLSTEVNKDGMIEIIKCNLLNKKMTR